MKKIAMILIVLFLSVGVSTAAEITFAWNANTERDLAGYKLYAGTVSRFDPALDPDGILEKLQEQCESKPTPETIQECKDTWAEFCSDPEDPLCDYDFFTYDRVVDVGNVTEYKLLDVGDGPGFYAATAYDTSGNESQFSMELSLVINTSRPGAPQAFKATVRASKVTVETD
jgi:hypothetical protein